MANTYYDSQLTAEEIEEVLEAINGLLTQANNGKVLAISNGKLEARSVQWGGGGSAVLEPLSVTANGDYYPEVGVDGFDEVHVSVSGGGGNGNTVLHETEYQTSGAFSYSKEITIPKTSTYKITVQTYSNGFSLKINGVEQPYTINEGGNYTYLYYAELSLNAGDIITMSCTSSGRSIATFVVTDMNGGGGGTSDNDLLFHFDGNFRNSGSFPAAFNNLAGMEISNEQSKFGGSSLKCGTDQSQNNVALDPSFAFGNNDFTLDFWCYPTNMGTGSSMVVPISFNYRSLAFYINTVSINYAVAKTNSSWTLDKTIYMSFSNNNWVHLALVRNGSDIYLFVNGVKVDTYNFGTDAIAPIDHMTLGSNTYSYGDRRFNGYIDELRLKIGEAVWTSDFTPPAQPYT